MKRVLKENMLIRLVYILFFMVILCGVMGFVMNSSDAEPIGSYSLYETMIGGQGMIAPDSSAQLKFKANRVDLKDYSETGKVLQDQLRNQMRDLRSRIQGFRNADKTRRQEANHKLNTLNQKNDDNIRRQQDRMRDLQQMSRNRMSNVRNHR